MQSLAKKAVMTQIFGAKDWSYFWERIFLFRWLPLLLGSGLGICLAFLITDQNWLVVLAIVLIVPLVMLFSRYPFIGFILWLLVTPLVAKPSDQTYLFVFLLLHRALIPLTLIAVFLPYLFRLKETWPIRLGRAELAMAAFLGIIILSVLLEGPAHKMGLFYKIYDRYVMGFSVYLIIRLTKPNEKDWRRLVWVVLFGAVFQSVIGLLSNFAPEVLPELWYNTRARTIGTFNSPGRYTSMLVFCGFIVYQAAMQWKRSKSRGLLLAVFALSSLMIFLTYAKASWLSASVALLGVFILYPLPTLRISIIAAILMALFGVGLLADQLAFATERLVDDSTQERVVGNVAMWRMIQAEPFFGWGYGNLDTVMPQFVVRLEGYAATEVAPHNTYLPMMAQLGLVGFFLYIFPFLWWLILTIRAWPWMPRAGFTGRSLVVLLWLTILNQFIVSNTSDFDNGQSGVFAICLWWATLGLIASRVYPYLNAPQAETLPAVTGANPLHRREL